MALEAAMPADSLLRTQEAAAGLLVAGVHSLDMTVPEPTRLLLARARRPLLLV